MMRMRLNPVVAAAVALALATPAAGQEWIEFASRDDRFTCNFPSQPAVTQTTWTSEYGAVLPGRIYTANAGQSRYSMTVIDYNGIENLLT